MSNRVVYGNQFSENLWPMVDEGSCNWVTVPGTNPPVSLEIQQGWPTAILRAWVADHNAYVEPVRDADSACWTPTNSVASSNHLSGTAVDIDWQSHPFQVSYAGFNDAQIATIREMLDFYEDTIWWGEDWGLQGIGPFDCMHVNLHPGTYNNPHTGDVIARKIRADGFSTFRRGAAPAPSQSVVTVPLVQKVDGTWTSSSPAWAHLIQRESSGNPTIIQQIIDVNSGGNEAEGLFQITPRTWLAHDGDDFAPSPRLATPQQQAIVAARIFTRNPSGSDWGAGLAGRESAQQLAAGLVLTATATPQPQPPGEDDWLNMPTNQEKLDAIYGALFTPQAPENIYRDVGDTAGQNLPDSIKSVLSIVYESEVERLALEGEQASIDKVVRVARGLGPELRPWAITRAQLIWNLGEAGVKVPPPVEMAVRAPTVAPPAPTPPTPVVYPAARELSDAYAEIARLRAQLTATPPALPAVPEPAPLPAVRTGDYVKGVVNSLEDWTEQVLSMDVKQRAAFTTSIKALEIPSTNGSQP